jgi:hypothetical protein
MDLKRLLPSLYMLKNWRLGDTRGQFSELQGDGRIARKSKT